MSWAAYGARISKVEQNITSYACDHDTLIELNTKVDLILKTVYEVQKDLKDHLKK